MRTMADESVWLVLTFPPYNIKNSTGNGLKNGSGAHGKPLAGLLDIDGGARRFGSDGPSSKTLPSVTYGVTNYRELYT